MSKNCIFISYIYCLKNTLLRKETFFIIQSVSYDTRFLKWRRKHAESRNVSLFLFGLVVWTLPRHKQNVPIWKAILTPDDADEIDSENDKIGSD